MDIRSVSAYLGICLLFFSTSYGAEPDQSIPLGVEQKLKNLYDLYRAGETVSLSSHELRFNLGVSYLVEDQNTLGIQTSKNDLALNSTVSYGLADWLETGLSIPLRFNQVRIKTSEQELFEDTNLGLGGIGLRFISTLPTRRFNTTAIVSLTLLTGDKKFGGNQFISLIGLNVAKILRPAFVYGGLAWQRDWEENINGIVYSSGLGFFLNHALSVGVEISGIRYLNPLMGSAYDMVSSAVRASYQSNPSFGLAPFVSIGLTDSAPDVSLGMNLFWRIR